MTELVQDFDPLEQARTAENGLRLRRRREPKLEDLNFGFNDNGLGMLVSGRNNIRQQIFNVLSTLFGEEDFEPEYGSDLPLRLFDPINDSTAFKLETDTIQALNRAMQNRIQVNFQQSQIIGIPEEDAYSITVGYFDLETKTEDRFQFTLMRR